MRLLNPRHCTAVNPAFLAPLLFLLTLSNCSFFRGYQDGEAVVLRTSQMIDKELTTFDLSSLSESAAEDIVVFKNGMLLKGREAILGIDTNELNGIAASGAKINCCNYIEGPHSAMQGNLATVWYVAQMEMYNDAGERQTYLGYITRIFQQVDHEWKIVHAHQDWQPENNPGPYEERNISSEVQTP